MTELTPPSCSACHSAYACLSICFGRHKILLQDLLPVPKVLTSLKSKLEVGLLTKDKNIRLLLLMCVCGRKVEGKDIQGEEDVIFKKFSGINQHLYLGSFGKCLKAGVRGEFAKGSFLSPWRHFIIFALEGLIFFERERSASPRFPDLYLIDLWGGVENIYSYKCSEDTAY